MPTGWKPKRGIVGLEPGEQQGPAGWRWHSPQRAINVSAFQRSQTERKRELGIGRLPAHCRDMRTAGTVTASSQETLGIIVSSSIWRIRPRGKLGRVAGKTASAARGGGAPPCAVTSGGRGCSLVPGVMPIEPSLA